ncbi:MAG: H(+)/Cl(-) exchange transporter ClcA [Acidobacteria bacterium]|nr:H(+)/Cl(-) exchange transporter ClcA [Acidobacteriota bacterium]
MSDLGVGGSADRARRGWRSAAAPVLEKERRRRQFLRAALVGLIAGLLAVLFKEAVQRTRVVSAYVAALTPQWGLGAIVPLVLVASALGALVAWLTGRYAAEAGGSGIPHVKAVLLGARVIRPVRLLLIKFGCGFGALAAGMSLGREGPTVQMGAAVGKLVGDVLRVRRRSYPALIASGAGAGLAAAFNAPLAGFIFVMEELKREMSPLTYGTALIGSVSAVAVSRFMSGQGSSFTLPGVAPVPLRVLPLVALFGCLAGLMGVLFNKALVAAMQLREQLRIPRAVAGAFVGALSGLLLVVFPDVTGVGHDVTERLLAGRFTAQHLVLGALAVFAGKLVLTVLSYATGVPGGIFAPLLVMGAFFGFAFGCAAQLVLPDAAISPAVFGTIGMCGMLAGSVRAPLTGVVLIVEMTSEYGLLYALLLGAFAAYLAAEGVRDEPIYERLLQRDLHAARGFVHPESEPVVLEVLVEPDSRLDGKRVRELESLPGTLVATVQRGSRHIVPNPETLLLAGDVLTVVTEGHDPSPAAVYYTEAARAVERP